MHEHHRGLTPACATGSAPNATIGEVADTALVCVARDPDDWRCIHIRLADLYPSPTSATSGARWMIDTGGRRRPLPEPMIGGYIERHLIPADAPFGHSGSHRPGRLQVIIQERHMSAAVLAELRETAAPAKDRAGRRLKAERDRWSQECAKAWAAMTPDLVQAARDWLANRGLVVAGADAYGLSERAIGRALGRHYDGGLPGFVFGAPQS